MASNPYDGFRWIKLPKYVMDETKSWEDRYKELEEHHVRETTFLIDKVRELAAKLAELNDKRDCTAEDAEGRREE